MAHGTEYRSVNGEFGDCHVHDTDIIYNLKLISFAEVMFVFLDVWMLAACKLFVWVDILSFQSTSRF